MTLSARLFMLLSALMLVAHPSLAKDDAVKTDFKYCTSPNYSFTTICPTNSWNRIDWFDDSISIVNFPFSERDEGVIIKKNGAQIIVSRTSLHDLSFWEWIKNDSTGANVSPVGPTQRLGQRSGCDDVAYLNVKVEQGLGTPEVDSQIYCKRKKYVLKFQVRFWENDPKGMRYKAILWTMFNHLRFGSDD